MAGGALVIWAILLGYAIGSIPSAGIIARCRGHDLPPEELFPGGIVRRRDAEESGAANHGRVGDRLTRDLLIGPSYGPPPHLNW